MERCVGTHTEGQARGLNRVQKIAAKFANNINGSGWETSAQRRLVARRNMRPFQGIHRETGLESDRG